MPKNAESPPAADRTRTVSLSSHTEPNRLQRSKYDVNAPGCLPFRMAVRAAGLDLQGHSFLTECHTEIITRSGCTVLMKEALAIDDEVDLRIASREVRGRVAGVIRALQDGYIYAVEFDPAHGFRWDASFPEATEPAETVQLFCSACDLPAEVALLELDALVYDATGTITRACRICGERTRWTSNRGAIRPPAKAPLPPPAAALPVVTCTQTAPPIRRPANDRKSIRVQLKGAKACLETPVRGTDIVSVINISKGGMRFASAKRYERGDWMRVAVPYTPGGINIFVAGEIVRIHKEAADGLPGEYAIKFRPA